MAILDFLRLLRPKQWYKNLLVFIPLIFGIELFSGLNLWNVFLGFIALSLISSVGYILNDMKDRKADRAHPEKKHRPIASGKVALSSATVIAIVIFIASMALGYSLHWKFLMSMLLLFSLTQVYTLFFKDEAFIDILLISVNFVIRTVAGAFIIGGAISPWLVMCPFFFALFLASCKRKSDSLLLKKTAQSHKKVLKFYDAEITNMLMIVSTTLLIMSFSVYISVSKFSYLFFSIPVILYGIFRFIQLTNSGSPIARHPDKAIKDMRLVLSSIIFVLMVVTAIYISMINFSIF